jgi:LPS sulfotransferase NodH
MDTTGSDKSPKRVDRGQRVICITAAQRAGATALQNAVRAGNVLNYGEVFHPQPLEDAAGTFLRFAEERDIRLSETATRSGAAAIAEDYLNWLREQAAPQHVLIDVKLNSWFVLSSWWQYPHREPFFLHYLKQKRAVFVFIWRENLADQVLSLFIAREFGIWHDLTAEKVAGRTLRAPVTWLKELAVLIARAEDGMLDHLRDYPDKVVICYEELFLNGRLSEQFRSAFVRITGIGLPRTTSGGVPPNSANKRDIIENYDEVIAAIRPISESRRLQLESRIAS